MSEPARNYTAHDTASRPPAGPLRDWLAAMKAATSASSFDAFPEALPPTRESAQAASDARNAEANAAWTPRVVEPEAPAAEEPASDVSELMAENIMLKAKLKLENDRYDVLQGLVARELRSLRAHVEEEMQNFDDVSAERDRIAAKEEEAQRDLGALRVEIAEKEADFERNLTDLKAEGVAKEEQFQRSLTDLQAEAAAKEADFQRSLTDLRAHGAAQEADFQREIGDLHARIAAQDEAFRRQEEAFQRQEEDFQREAGELRARIAADAASLAEVRNERDLWADRAEALAQPIFQKRNAA